MLRATPLGRPQLWPWSGRPCYFRSRGASVMGASRLVVCAAPVRGRLISPLPRPAGGRASVACPAARRDRVSVADAASLELPPKADGLQSTGRSGLGWYQKGWTPPQDVVPDFLLLDESRDLSSACTVFEDLRAAKHISQVVAAVSAGSNARALDGMAVSMALKRLSQMLSPSRARTDKSLRGVFLTLEDHAERHAQTYGPRALAIASHSLAKMGRQPCSALWALLDEAERRAVELSPEDASILLWASATASRRQPPGTTRSPPQLFRVLGPFLASSASHLSPRSLANVAWAHATTGVQAPGLMVALQAQAARRASELNPQDVATILWAFSSLGHCPAHMFQALDKEIATRADEFNPQDLAMALSAFASVDFAAPLAFRAAERAALRSVSHFHPRTLASMASAFGEAGRSCSRLLDAFAVEASARRNELVQRDFCDLLKAFQQTGHEPSQEFLEAYKENIRHKGRRFTVRELVGAIKTCTQCSFTPAEALTMLSKEATRRVKDRSLQMSEVADVLKAFAGSKEGFAITAEAIERDLLRQAKNLNDPEAIKDILWAYAKAGHSTGLFSALEPRLMKTAPRLFPRHISTLLWAYAEAGCGSERLFRCLGDVALRDLAALTPNGFVNLLHAFSHSKTHSPRLFDACQGHVVWQANNFSMRDLANVARAYAVANVPGQEVFDCIELQAMQRTAEMSGMDLTLVLWALAASGRSASPLFAHLTARAVSAIPSLPLLRLSELMWAFACHTERVGRTEPTPQAIQQVFQAGADTIANSAAELTPRQLSKISWAFSKAGSHSEPLWAHLSHQTMLMADKFRPDDLAVVTNAISGSGCATPEMLLDLGVQLVAKAPSLGVSGVANAARAFSSFKGCEKALRTLVVGALEVPALAALDKGLLRGSDLAAVVWAFAEAGIESPRLTLASRRSLMESALCDRGIDDSALDDSIWALVAPHYSSSDYQDVTLQATTKTFLPLDPATLSSHKSFSQVLEDSCTVAADSFPPADIAGLVTGEEEEAGPSEQDEDEDPWAAYATKCVGDHCSTDEEVPASDGGRALSSDHEALLRTELEASPRLLPTTKRALAAALGCGEDEVAQWFKTERAKLRRLKRRRPVVALASVAPPGSRRFRPSEAQLDVLEAAFIAGIRLTKQHRLKVASDAQCTEDEVRMWFRNRRRRVSTKGKASSVASASGLCVARGSKARAPRFCPTAEQEVVLKAALGDAGRLTRDRRQSIAAQAGCSEDEVKRWFRSQRRRAS